jgi:hypothetical protein
MRTLYRVRAAGESGATAALQSTCRAVLAERRQARARTRDGEGAAHPERTLARPASRQRRIASRQHHPIGVGQVERYDLFRSEEPVVFGPARLARSIGAGQSEPHAATHPR